MRKQTLLALGLLAVIAAGCRVNQQEDAEGDESYSVEPAPVEIGTDTATLIIPDVDIGRDTTQRRDTTRR